MKKCILFMLLVVLVLSVTACGHKNNGSSESNGETTEITTNDKGEEGYYDGEGSFWLTDGSGYYDPQGTFVTLQAPDTSQNPTDATVFNTEVLGNYGDDSTANVVVEAGQATINYEGATYTLPGSAFREPRGEKTDIDYDFYVDDSGASGTLSFYEDTDLPLQVEVTYKDNSGTDLYFMVDRGYVLDRMPLEGYVSLDSQGEFGAIPMTEDVKKLLLEGMTEDYIFEYYPEFSAYGEDDNGNSVSLECTWYSITSYDENGMDNSASYSNDVYEFKNKKDADIFYKAEKEENSRKILKQSGNAVGESSSDDQSTEIYNLPGGKSSKIHCYSVYENGIVYGEHCMYDDYDKKYIYFSKPYTIEEGKVFNEATGLLRSLHCLDVPSSDGKYTLRVEGDIHENNINIKDSSNNTIMDGSCFIKADGNTLIAYQYDVFNSSTYVAELTLGGDTISVKYYRYDGTGEITFDNYKEKQAAKEGEFQVIKTVAE